MARLTGSASQARHHQMGPAGARPAAVEGILATQVSTMHVLERPPDAFRSILAPQSGFGTSLEIRGLLRHISAVRKPMEDRRRRYESQPKRRQPVAGA